LNELFVSLIQSSPYFSIVTPPILALTVFRLQQPLNTLLKELLSDNDLNSLCSAFYDRISKRHDILLTHTVLNDAFCVRFVVGAEMTTEEHVEKAFDIICEERDAAEKDWRQRPSTEN
jgi:aromatic-L-amino-acid decarboxylase